MSKLTVHDPQGRAWTIREVGGRPILGLPPDAWVWKAGSRHNGPEVIERIAQAIRDDRLPAAVEGASFVRFD